MKGQLKTVYNAFYEAPKTMKEVDQETGIMRENICRYCRTLRKADLLHPVKIRRCKVTGFPNVIAWTTNPDLTPIKTQLKLF